MSVALSERPAQTGTQTAGMLAGLRRRLESSDAMASLCAVADQALISGTSFVTAVAVGRSCGAETLGLYTLIVAAVAMLIGIADQLITAPYMMFHHHRHGRQLAAYQGSVLLHQLMMICLTVAVAAGLTAFVRSPHTRLIGLILTLTLPGLLMRAYLREMALAHNRMLDLLLLDGGICGCQLLTVTLMMLTGATNLTTLYGLSGAACLVSVALWWRTQSSRLRFSRRACRIHWQRNWRFGRWALATHLAGCSTPYVMPWVLFALCGKAETGLLGSASVIVGMANILLSGLADFLTPRAARAYATGGVAKLRSILRSMLGISLLAIGSVCAVAMFFGQSIVDTLYDGRFPDVGMLISLLTFSVLANAVGNVAGNGLWALNLPRANFVADMLTLIVAIAAAPVMIRPWGATGAAMATLTACTCGAIVRQAIFLQSVRAQGSAGSNANGRQRPPRASETAVR
ncbi:MAG: lipopolysaccharide biosynthesis protein [Planctomycetaceae bacterium]|nr:lipopolysaccharide biosynthesis protein [Planctomycetaceae bacterium]